MLHLAPKKKDCSSHHVIVFVLPSLLAQCPCGLFDSSFGRAYVRTVFLPPTLPGACTNAAVRFSNVNLTGWLSHSRNTSSFKSHPLNLNRLQAFRRRPNHTTSTFKTVESRISIPPITIYQATDHVSRSPDTIVEPHASVAATSHP